MCESLNGHLDRTMPWTPIHIRLPIEPALFTFTFNGAWKEIGGVIEMLVLVL